MKRVSVAFTMALTVLLCTGCTNYAKEYDNNTIIVNKNGSIVEVAKEDYKGTDVSAEELERYIDEQVNLYNEECGSKCIKKKALLTEDMSKTKLVLKYSSVEDYNGFNSLECILCDYEDAKDDILKGSFCNAQGESVTSDKFENTDKAKVLVISEATDLVFPKEILYYNKEVKIEKGVITSSGKEDAIVIFK